MPLAAVLALVACGGGNPLNFGGTTTPEPEPTDPTAVGEEVEIVGVEVPLVLKQHLRTASYTPGAPTMRIDLRTLDGTPLAATYQRSPEFDAAGFEAYTVQETRSQRQFLALFKRGSTVEAGAVADGGQFVNYFGGATFSRMQPFTLPQPEVPPTGGTNLEPQPTLLATYTGGYVGLLNSGVEVPNSTLSPHRSYRITGDVALNADFNADNMAVNGQISNRFNVDKGEEMEIHTVYLAVTQITASGAFSGLIKFSPTETRGNYAGLFGGDGAVEAAGATIFNPIAGDSTVWEHGAFVATKCVAGDPAPCP